MKASSGDGDQGDQRITSFRSGSGDATIESQAVLIDCLDDDRLAGLERRAVGALRLPELAVDEHEVLAAHLRRTSPTSRCAPTYAGIRRACAAFVRANPKSSVSVPEIASATGSDTW